MDSSAKVQSDELFYGIYESENLTPGYATKRRIQEPINSLQVSP